MRSQPILTNESITLSLLHFFHHFIYFMDCNDGRMIACHLIPKWYMETLRCELLGGLQLHPISWRPKPRPLKQNPISGSRIWEMGNGTPFFFFFFGEIGKVGEIL